MIFFKDLKITEENENKNEYKFKFQGQSSRLQRWFDIDFGWIEETFSTREPGFIRQFIKDMMKHKIQIHSKCMYLQLAMTKM